MKNLKITILTMLAIFIATTSFYFAKKDFIYKI